MCHTSSTCVAARADGGVAGQEASLGNLKIGAGKR